MLVLSRRRGQSIMIGDNIEITIMDIREGKVRLGIVAPKNVQVDRKEIYEEKQRDQVLDSFLHSGPGRRTRPSEKALDRPVSGRSDPG